MDSYLVLHVAETLKGGIASYLEEILPAQVSTLGSTNVHILAPLGPEVKQYDALGVNTHVFGSSRYRVINILRLIYAITNFTRCNKVDIVHAHSTFAGVAVRIAFSWLRSHTKVVYCSHGWAFDRVAPKYINFVYKKIELFLSRYTDSIICISNHDFQSAKAIGISETRLSLISNAISTELPYPGKIDWPDSTQRFLFIGRFDKQKGIDIFVEAMRLLKGDAFAYLIGSPVVDDNSMKSLPANVATTGWLSREVVQHYILSAHVVVVPSRWEGFGLIALEAMRASKPVIASRVGGLAELVIDGKTGFLVQQDSTSELASKMRKCFDGSVDLCKLGEAAHTHFVQNYTAQRLNQELFAMYSDLLKNGRYAIEQ